MGLEHLFPVSFLLGEGVGRLGEHYVIHETRIPMDWIKQALKTGLRSVNLPLLWEYVVLILLNMKFFLMIFKNTFPLKRRGNTVNLLTPWSKVLLEKSTHLPKNRFNIIFPSKPRSSEWSLSLKFPASAWRARLTIWGSVDRNQGMILMRF
jgi:hypothetical protein